MLTFLSHRIEQTSLLTGKPVELVRSRCTRAHWGPSRANKAEKMLSQDLFCRNDRATLVTLGAPAIWLFKLHADEMQRRQCRLRFWHLSQAFYNVACILEAVAICRRHYGHRAGSHRQNISNYVIVSRGNLSSASRKARHKLGSDVTFTHINGYRNNLHPP